MWLAGLDKESWYNTKCLWVYQWARGLHSIFANIRFFLFVNFEN